MHQTFYLAPGDVYVRYSDQRCAPHALASVGGRGCQRGRGSMGTFLGQDNPPVRQMDYVYVAMFACQMGQFIADLMT